MGDRVTLAIDIGTTFGWALGKNGIITHSGSITLPPPEPHPGHRFIKFHEFLMEFKNVNEIYYERVPGFKSGDAAKMYGAQQALIQMHCLVHGIRMRSMRPGDIKRLFTGNGNAPKEMMCEIAHKLGWQGGHAGTRLDHDECDAIALMWIIYKELGYEPRFETTTARLIKENSALPVDKKGDLRL